MLKDPQIATAVDFLRSRMVEADGAVYNYSGWVRPLREEEYAVLVMQPARHHAYFIRILRLCEECPVHFVGNIEEFSVGPTGIRLVNSGGGEGSDRFNTGWAICLFESPFRLTYDFSQVFSFNQQWSVPCVPQLLGPGERPPAR